MVRTTATVLRRESAQETPAEYEVDIATLVPGDIIYLSAGDLVPADVRLLDSRDLFISQAILTGESLPVEKYDVTGNIASKGDKAVVVATGSETYFGSLAKSIVGNRAQTAFDRGVNSVSWLLIRFMLVPVLINGLTKGDWLDALLFELAVAVGLTPEMLPMIVSSNLAKGAIAMSQGDCQTAECDSESWRNGYFVHRQNRDAHSG